MKFRNDIRQPAYNNNYFLPLTSGSEPAWPTLGKSYMSGWLSHSYLSQIFMYMERVFQRNYWAGGFQMPYVLCTRDIYVSLYLLTLGVHAQWGLQYFVCVCVFVCLSVYGYSGITGYRAVYKWYQRLQNNESMKNKKVIIPKWLCSGDKLENILKADMLIEQQLTSTSSCTFSAPWRHEVTWGMSIESNVVLNATFWCS